MNLDTLNLDLLRKTVSEHCESTFKGNLTRWCRAGDPKLNQSTVHKFLSGDRSAGLRLFYALCKRMSYRPSFFYRSATPDILRDRLSLLSEMVTDPIFPFGKEDLFENLADQIETLYTRYLEVKGQGK